MQVLPRVLCICRPYSVFVSVLCFGTCLRSPASVIHMTEASKRKGGIRKRPPVDADDEGDEAAAALLRCSSLLVCA